MQYPGTTPREGTGGGPSSASKRLPCAFSLQPGVLRRARRGQWWPCRTNMVRGNTASFSVYGLLLICAFWDIGISKPANSDNAAGRGSVALFFMTSWADFSRCLSVRLLEKASLLGSCSDICILRAVKFFKAEKNRGFERLSLLCTYP